MKFSGQLFFSYVIMYSIYRFSVDFLRYYSPEEHIGVLVYSQVTSLVLGLTALIIMIWKLPLWEMRMRGRKIIYDNYK